MVRKILGCSAVLGLLATSALVVGCSKDNEEDAAGGGNAVISTSAFSVDCTLSTVQKGKTINGFLEGSFTVEKDRSLTPGKTVNVSIGTRGKNDYTLKVKSGAIVDAKNEIFEFVASQNVKAVGYDFDVMDITIRYDGTKKTADVDSIVTGKDTYNASCTFKDAQGRNTTNF